MGEHVSGWWSACEAQIKKERAEDRDPDEYRDFEQLVGRLRMFRVGVSPASRLALLPLA